MTLPEFSTLDLSLSEDGCIATWKIHHGKANEMGSQQLKEIEALIQWLQSETGPRALLTYSDRVSKRGTPIFISGANVTERIGWSNDRVKEHVRYQRNVLNRLRRVPVFHVCVVSGVALGWGTEFMLTADYRIGAPGAVFGLPETSLGILPGAGGTTELYAQVGLAHALRLGITGERIQLEEASRIGLIQECVEDVSTGLTRARTLAMLAAKNSPTAIAAFKRAMLSSIGVPDEVRRENEAKAYELCVDSGQAAIGRENFDLIRRGESPDWGPRKRWNG